MDFVERGEWDGDHVIIQCKKALSPSNLPGIDYALNPYGGCEHGCVYCYAPEVTHSEWKDWRIVRIKENIPRRLSMELAGLTGVIGIGTVTDPYQAAERKHLLTRMCLEVLKRKDFEIHLNTKSDLILRDIDILSKMKGQVGISITGIDRKSSWILEPGAPEPEYRLNALKALVDADIDTYALIGPVLDTIKDTNAFCNAIMSTGVKRVQLDRLNGRPLLNARMDARKIHGSDRVLEDIRKRFTDAGLLVEDVF